MEIAIIGYSYYPYPSKDIWTILTVNNEQELLKAILKEYSMMRDLGESPYHYNLYKDGEKVCSLMDIVDNIEVEIRL